MYSVKFCQILLRQKIYDSINYFFMSFFFSYYTFFSYFFTSCLNLRFYKSYNFTILF